MSILFNLIPERTKISHSLKNIDKITISILSNDHDSNFNNVHVQLISMLIKISLKWH